VKETFPSARVIHLVTTAEEETMVVLANENEMENIAVCDDHPCGGKVCDSCCLSCSNLFAVVEETMTAMENDFDQKGKNDKNPRGSVSVKVTVVAVVPCRCPSSKAFQSPHASSN
jgi:hypothetical protein